MKLAVQLSGQQRYGSYLKNILDVLNVFDHVDIFAHHWDVPRSKDDLEFFIRDSITSDKMFLQTLEVEKQIQFFINPNWRTHGHPIFGIMSMTYSIWKSNFLRRQYERTTGIQYDLVMRVRPDIQIHNFPQNKEWFEKINENAVYVGRRTSNIAPHINSTIQDQIAIAKPSTMNTYSELYNNFDKFFLEGGIFGPEILFYWWLKTKNNFNVNETEFLPEIDLRGLPNIDYRTQRQKY
jgi:hypothetical protein